MLTLDVVNNQRLKYRPSVLVVTISVWELSNINWQSLFLNLSFNVMSLLFTDTFLSQHISNKIITCNDKDAPYITIRVKFAIRHNSRVHRK